ncbi:MAG: hypothetical protein U5J95_08345 [Balneolaceae bacterium]|nr:hypothetical protein [Balneolaceae bacterium]
MVELPDSPFYEKVGAPDNHNGTNDPCRAPESLTSSHFSNHWGTETLVASLQNIAATFDSLYPESGFASMM